MTNEPWNTHTPGDPMPCKCGDSVVEVKLRQGTALTGFPKYWSWGELKHSPEHEITEWRFIERKGEDVIAADPYSTLEWDEDDTAIVVLKELHRPEWVLDYDLVRFARTADFQPAIVHWSLWWEDLAFQIKRRQVPLTPAEPQLLALLSVATDDKADVILSAARRANIEVPE